MMKKYFITFCLFLGAGFLFAQENSYLFIHPGRETFVYFPSDALGSTNTVTFFLPEKFTPLHKNYPLVVMLGVVPKQAEEVAKFQAIYPSIVVGINFEEKDYRERALQIEKFLSEELLPYTDTNYRTQTGPENRVLAVHGRQATQLACQITQNPHLYGAIAIVSPEDLSVCQRAPQVRTLVIGNQDELARAQQYLETHQKTYGPDFALRYISEQNNWFEAVDVDYLLAPKAQTQLASIHAAVRHNKLSLTDGQDTSLRVWVTLKNNGLFHYVPTSLLMSPPFLQWTAQTGTLKIIPGATAGTVLVRNQVDKPAFAVKIKLKK